MAIAAWRKVGRLYYDEHDEYYNFQCLACKKIWGFASADLFADDWKCCPYCGIFWTTEWARANPRYKIEEKDGNLYELEFYGFKHFEHTKYWNNEKPNWHCPYYSISEKFARECHIQGNPMGVSSHIKLQLLAAKQSEHYKDMPIRIVITRYDGTQKVVAWPQQKGGEDE